MNKEKCVEKVRHSLVKVGEKGRIATFKNPTNEEFLKIQVDGCLVTIGVRADAIVSNESSSVIVEFKGGGLNHACEQLFSTVENEVILPYLKKKVGFLIVCSKYPSFDSFVRKAKMHALKKYRCGFHVVCNRGEFDIDRITAIDGPR